METKLLQEKSRVIAVTAEVEQGDYRYDVNYDFSDKKLGKMNCNIYKKEGNEYSGFMSYDDGKTNFSFPKEEGIEIHIGVFKKIVTEVKESIK